MKAFASLVALLSLDAQGGDRPRIESLKADRLACLLAIAIGTVVKAGNGRVEGR